MKQQILSILALITALAGGGTLQYQSSSNAYAQSDVNVNTATFVADLIIKVNKLEEKVKELEKNQ